MPVVNRAGHLWPRCVQVEALHYGWLWLAQVMITVAFAIRGFIRGPGGSERMCSRRTQLSSYFCAVMAAPFQIH
jgi:hypothetical protein